MGRSKKRLPLDSTSEQPPAMMTDMLRPSLLALLVVSSVAFGADADQIERGRYLAVEVGKCQDCHTPIGENGELDKTKWMKGAELPIQPLKEIKGWHTKSPDLTSGSRLFQRWKEEGIVKFLVTGKNPNGGKADAPMPTYTMKQEDAEAIVAYLKSLK